MKKLVVSTGSGISAPSGIPTFRDVGGLWENYPVMDVCSADGFRRNPALVHQFYNDRRHQYLGCQPNEAHRILASLQQKYDTQIITQNVDDLHERAGSQNVLHLHGNIMEIRSVIDPQYIERLTPPDLDTTPATKGRNGHPMRPNIVFFQEPVPNFEKAVELVRQADIFIVIGTSLAVYPAASLLNYVSGSTPVYYIDPKPAHIDDPRIHIIPQTAIDGLRTLFPDLP